MIDLEIYYQKIMNFDPEDKDILDAGEFILDENEDFLLDLAERVSNDNPSIFSYDRFNRMFTYTIPKPIEPLYSSIAPNPSYKDRTQRLVRKILEENRLKSKYEEELIEHHNKIKEQWHFKNKYIQGVNGYIKYFKDQFPDQVDFFTKKRMLPLTDTDRKRHTYVSGSAGIGKTEALKVLIHHYIEKNPNTAVVLIDPHGAIAKEVARFKENKDSDRLVYIDPVLDNNFSPIFNPLDVSEICSDNNSVDFFTQYLAESFAEIISTGFSLQMKTLLEACLATLLLRPESTLIDLKRFMVKGDNADLLEYARHLPNPETKAFIERDFMSDSYKATRQSILTKFQSLFNSHVFTKFINGSNTFRFDELLRRRSIIIFDFGQVGSETTTTIGRSIIAKLFAFGRRQDPDLPQNKHKNHTIVPVHLFVDECQLFLSRSTESVLTQARKFGIHATLANQFIGQDMDTQIKRAILGNTAIKISGRNEFGTRQAISKETGADLKELENLKIGEFHIKADSRPSIKVKMPTHLLGTTHCVSEEEWEEIKREQLLKYYRPLKDTQETTELVHIPQESKRTPGAKIDL